MPLRLVEYGNTVIAVNNGNDGWTVIAVIALKGLEK
jgi:hypothetical protein